jgi:predicted RNA-binding protein with PUA-like domain
MKSEPDVYSFDQLKNDKTTSWDGVRNYQARNFMRDEMKKGDQVLFYHSNTKPPGIAGVAEVSKEGFPDPSQFKEKGEYFDPKATQEKPRWFCVQVKYKKAFKDYVSLDDLKNRKSLSDMLVVQKGQRLSVQPVTKTHFDTVCKMGGL